MTCRACRNEYDPEDFDQRKNSRGDALRATRCMACRRAYYKSYYQANKKRCQAKVADDKKRRKEWLRLYKIGKQCSDCKQSFYCPEVLDFDHVGSDKRGNVSWLVDRQGMKAALAEIAKCELVCANCHRIRTWRRRRKPAPIALIA